MPEVVRIPRDMTHMTAEERANHRRITETVLKAVTDALPDDKDGLRDVITQRTRGYIKKNSPMA